MLGFGKKKEVPIRQPRITSQNESYAFRRSRTLTGSTAPTIRSVSEDRAQLKSPRIHLHELRSHRRKLGFYLFGTIALLAAGGLLVIQFVGGVADVRSTPVTSTADTSRYVKILDDYYSAHPAERFRFALSKSRLMSYLADKAPEVASMNVQGSSNIGYADLAIEFRQPVVAWEIARQKYYVDANGHDFKINYYPEPTVIVKDQSGINPDTGAVASNRFLHYLGRVVSLVNASGIAKVTGVVIPPNTTREVDLQLEGRGFVVKTLLDRDPAAQTTDILNVLKYLDARGIKPQYVDVRIAGKAFYK